MTEQNKQQKASQSNTLTSCRCNTVEHSVCCCAHKGGSGCKNACCTNGAKNLNSSKE